MKNIGYCCIALGPNENLSKKEQITINRGMIKKTFESKGLSYVSELTLLNLDDCLKILKYNLKKGIYIYRMSSDMLPCLGFYKIEDLPRIKVIESKLKAIGDFVKSNGMRVSFHPSHFNIIASENPKVVENSIDELDKHAQIMDIMGLEQTTLYPINIHIGTTKPSCSEAAERFCQVFPQLSESCRKRLTVENDDSPNQYSVKMLHEMVYQKIGIPIVADSLHHQCFNGGQTWEEALRMAVSTWTTRPLCHHSSSKKLFEDSTSKLEAHADFLYEKFESFDLELDIELECKQKDISLLKYRKDFLILS
jgi:UV DNA damage endonuclease